MSILGEFYVSDSYTLQYGAPATAHYPGPFNTSKIYGPSENVIVSLEAGELGFIVYHEGLDGVNLDVTMTLYDVTPPGTAISTTWVLPFLPPFGGAPNGILMNAAARAGQYALARRDPKRPVRVGVTTPAIPGRIYMVGAGFVVNCGVAGQLAYQYFMQGTFESI